MLVREMQPGDEAWVTETELATWHAPTIVRLGESLELAEFPALIALLDDAPAGVCRYVIRGDSCEVVAIFASVEGRGVATALLDGVLERARAAGCRRLWIVTTNDNLRALGVYQRWGFDMCAFHRDGMTRGRLIKPEIPEVGASGIPLRHELELELTL